MKGRIFIAWSGKNDMAIKIKNALEAHDYVGVVGGEGGTSSGLFVGHAVLDEINHCNQAIFIVQKKDNGTISNNLMFEFGYSLARFSSNKIHVFYIDINPNDESIPSDLKGIWAEFYKESDYENLAEVITAKFLSSQKHIIPEDKINVIDNYYGIKNMLQLYSDSPRCSEYELSQYVILFAQAGYLFNAEKETLTSIKNLSSSLRNPGEELSLAISLSVSNIELFLNIQKDNDILYLKKEDYRNFDRRLKNIESTVDNWEEDDFSLWVKVVMCDIINYSKILYSSNPDISEERKNLLLNDSLSYAQKCLDACEKLAANATNQHFVELYMAYMYRNLATAHKALNASEETIREYISLSCKMRADLWDYYSEIRQINTKLLEIFEMEYYLALSEQLEWLDDPIGLEDSCDECMDYIRQVKYLNKEKSHFINKIEENIIQASKQ